MASVCELSRQYGVNRYSIQSWCGLRKELELRREAPLPKGRPGTKLKTSKRLLNICKWKMNFCEIFCQWKEVKPSLKYQIIHTVAKKHPVWDMCQFFDVSRSGYYAFLDCKDRPDKGQPLAELIRECQSKRGKIHGYRYVHLWLIRQKQIQYNPKTVLRVMRKYDLLSEIRRRKYHPCGQQLHRYANLLNRSFQAETPNSKADTT